MSGGYHTWSKFNAHRWSNLNARRQAIPKHPPTTRELVRQIAMLGGFLGRKCDGEPGVINPAIK
jgi:hypothetical protein